MSSPSNHDDDRSRGSTGATPARPFDVLTEPGYRGVWVTGACVSSTRWLEFLAVSVFVLTLTGSAFDVSLVVFARFLPLMLFSGVIAAAAAVISRRRLLAAGLAIAAVLRVGLGVLVVFDLIGLWTVLGGMFVAGIIDAGEYPVRRTLAADYSGPQRVTAGLALDMATNFATMALGPIAGGYLLQSIGLEGAYFFGAALSVIGVVIAWGLPREPVAAAVRGRGFFADIAEAVRYVRGQRLLVGTLAITLIMNFWGWPYSVMVPVIGREFLGLSAGSIGLLMSAQGLGAFLTGLAIAAWPPSRLPRVYFFGTLVLFVAILLFPASPWFVVSFAILFGVGCGMAGFAACQSPLIFLNSTPAFRSRALGLLAMCVGVGPFGFLQVGLLADVIGARAAVTVIACEGLLALAAVAIIWPEFRRRPVAEVEKTFE